MNIALQPAVATLVSFSLSLLIFFLYYSVGLYGALRSKSVMHDFKWVLSVNMLAVFLSLGVLYLIKLNEFSRGVIGLFFVLSTFAILLKRYIMRLILALFREKGYNQKHVVIIGSGMLARQYAQEILNHPGFGYTIDGFIGVRDTLFNIPYLGEWENGGSHFLEKPGIDEVIVALDPEYMHHIPDLIEATEKSGSKLLLVPYYSNYIPTTSSIESIGECKLINVRTTPFDSPIRVIIKRTFDIFSSLFLLILCSPVLLLTAIGVKLSSPGPIIFRQQRVGQHKKLFKMYKFRSMRVNDAADIAWTTLDDPRKTKFGSLIRKTSIDELPQLWNVLKGDMSLIGPRPEIPYYVNQFKDTIPLYMLKHLVKPGITGWAQVNGFRGDTSIEERIKKDIWYIENWTFMLDLRIIVMTIVGGIFNKEL